MEKLIVNTKNHKYPIYITDSFDYLPDAFISDSEVIGKKVCVITDSNVSKLYLDTVCSILAKSFSDVNSFIFEAGEQSKNLSTISDFYKQFINNKMDRKSVVVALGGGVTGDMAGFAAATYMRGITYIQVPTTLLSQVDSSVGGKTGVDFVGANSILKNIIGAFYQPDFVYINTSVLSTLPHEEFVSGMGEVIKHGLLHDKSYYDFIRHNSDKIINLEPGTIKEVILVSCHIKAEIVGLDERECGIRGLLNLGHTFGHAIEAFYNFKLPHGHCVALGMCAALFLSKKKGFITDDDLYGAIRLFDYFVLPTRLPDSAGFDAGEIYNLMLMDKKVQDGGINLILLKNIGEAFIYKSANYDEIMAGLNFILCNG